MTSYNRRKRKGSVLDIKQVVFMLVGLCIGAGVIFIVGLQVGQHVDISSNIIAATSMDMISNPSKGSEKRQKAKAPKDEFAFFADLGSPAPERKRRKLCSPEGNANDPDRVTKRKRQVEARKARRQAWKKKRKSKADKTARTSPARVALSAVKVAPASPEGAVSRTISRVLSRGQGSVEKKREAQPAAKASFTVHVGSYPSFEEASAAMKRLRSKGHSPHVTLTNSESEGKIYRVRVGRFINQEEARNSGLRGAIVRL
jgi:cell division septation protein DedD